MAGKEGFDLEVEFSKFLAEVDKNWNTQKLQKVTPKFLIKPLVCFTQWAIATTTENLDSGLWSGGGVGWELPYETDGDARRLA